MSIYGNVVLNESFNYGKPVITDTIESIMEDGSIVLRDKDEDFVSEGLEIVSTITENYNTFMQRIGFSELSVLSETGEDMIYTENVVTDFLGSIKRFLMKIWEKIKSLFKRFIMMIDSYTKNDKAFINKYRQQIYRHKSLTDFTFKGYQYTIDESELKAATDALTAEANRGFKFSGSDNTGEYSDTNEFEKEFKDGNEYSQSKTGKYNDKLDDYFEKLRGDVIGCFHKGKGKAGRYTAEEYRKEIDAALRNGEEEKEELTDKEIDVDNMVTELQTSRDTKKKIDTLFKESKKVIDNDIKYADRLKREHTKTMPAELDDGEKATSGTAEQKKAADERALAKKRSDSKVKSEALNRMIKGTNASKAMLVTLNSCVLKALKERSRQYKACLVKVVYHNPKNEDAFMESYDQSSDYGFNNYISSIQFK